jgi:cyanophycin synthetase
VDAATERRIPSIRLNDGNLVQLGYGRRSRRIWTAETDCTSAIGETISRDKDLTKRLLQSCGVPVPEGQLVETAEDAWEAAEDIGLPVVVKPLDGNHGRGVSTNLKTREEVAAAFRLAEEEGSEVIVERFVPGNEHRLLVVGNRLVAAARGEAAWITGDGKSTVTALIDSQLNADPRRGTSEDHPLNLILLDEDPAVRLELTRQGFAADSIPAAGQPVLIQRNGNVAFDVTDQVHPSIAAVATLAARVVGLDIAGVDLVAEDIGLPLEQQGGAIVEVNAGPGLLMHLKPADGQAQPVGQAIVEHLFPAGPTDTCGRIPVVGITGGKGKTTVAQLVARILQLNGRHVGLACSSGLYLDRRHVQQNDAANWDAAHRVLLNRSVDAAVIETGSRSILAEGLAYDRCQVAVVTNLDAGEDLADYDVAGVDQVFGVLRTLVDVVLPDGVAVLNAADPEVLRMAPLCDGEVILFAIDPDEPAIVEHRALGCRAVFLRAGQVVLASGANESEITRQSGLPIGGPGQDCCQTENTLAAVAASWALGIAPDLIGAGIDTFGDTPERAAAVVPTSVRHKEKGATRAKRKTSS